MFLIKQYTYILSVSIIIVFILTFLIFTTSIQAKIEQVYVAKIMSNDDKAIIVRSNGEAYLIEKGIGCISLWRYEGKNVLIHSPGIFLGIGSKLLIPENDQECRIWDSEDLGYWSASPTFKNHFVSPTKVIDSSNVKLVQSSLKLLGFDVGEVDGRFGSKTIAALNAFQTKEGLPVSNHLGSQTYLALSQCLLKKYPNNNIIRQDVIKLLELSKNVSIKQSTTNVIESQIDGDFEGWEGETIVKLINGQIWQQSEYHYEYHYSYMPNVTIFKSDFGYKMLVDGLNKAIGVTRIK